MDQNEAVEERQVATPIFNVYRRGYDPEQVDRYVVDQQRRLDDALHRSSEAERRLAAAVNQLREAATEEVAEMREVASREASDVVDQATRRALAIRDETERRRHAYLQRIEQDRERAVSQITYLYDQRQDAIAELARLQTTVQAVVEEMARSPLGRPAPGVAVAAATPTASDGSPMLPPDDDTRVRPDRALNRSGASSPMGLAEQPDSPPYRAGERTGRHSSSFAADTSLEYQRDDMTPPRGRRNRDDAAAEPPPFPPGRSGGEIDEGVGMAADEVPEPVPSRRRRTGLFDAEQEGWT